MQSNAMKVCRVEEKWEEKSEHKNEKQVYRIISIYHTSNCIKMRRVSNEKLIDDDIKSCFCGATIEIIDNM